MIKKEKIPKPSKEKEHVKIDNLCALEKKRGKSSYHHRKKSNKSLFRHFIIENVDKNQHDY